MSSRSLVKRLPFVLFCALGLLLAGERMSAAESKRPSAPSNPTADRAWANLLEKMRNDASGSREKGRDAVAARALQLADEAKACYTEFPSHARAGEARKLEAIYLMEAVESGDHQSSARMEATVSTLRGDSSVSAYQRAVVAGAYEFARSREKIKGPDDAAREYEAVARRLIQEFPTEPQGYITLLTLAKGQASPRDQAMAREVASSQAPDAIRVQAHRLSNRFGLVGQSIDRAFAEAPGGGLGKAWEKGRPGLIYFWATWSPESLALRSTLGSLNPKKTNLVGICLDRDETVGAAAAATSQLPGHLIYLKYGVENPLAVLTGAFEAPLIYFVSENGIITDVRGSNDLEAKIKTLVR